MRQITGIASRPALLVAGRASARTDDAMTIELVTVEARLMVPRDHLTGADVWLAGIDDDATDSACCRTDTARLHATLITFGEAKLSAGRAAFTERSRQNVIRDDRCMIRTLSRESRTSRA